MCGRGKGGGVVRGVGSSGIQIDEVIQEEEVWLFLLS